MTLIMREQSIKVGIIGATGYSGMELLRLVIAHPFAQLVFITSRAESGRRVDAVLPSLRGKTALSFSTPDEVDFGGCDVAFCAAPNGVAMEYAPALLHAGAKVIDLSADFRLLDVAEWERWYGMPHACPDLVPQAVYGLPELCRQSIRQANLVANPGCYPTAIQLGLLPLLESGAVYTDSLIADAKSGVSGAGRKPILDTLLCEVSESFKAYQVPGHRHLPEIKQGLRRMAGADVGLVFVPHLAPMIRGIHATLYARLKQPIIELQALYEQRYSDEPFVDVLPAGAHPNTRSVYGSNVCRLAVHRPQDGDMAVILAVEDNLVKGAAGQAVQNMNLMFGLSETTGLDSIALVP